MKKLLSFVFISLLILACKEEKKESNYQDETLNVTTSIYPEEITKVFDTHGGIDSWNTFHGLSYEIEKPTVNEKHKVNLKSRESIIDGEHHQLGFDGENVWLKEKDTVGFKSNPRFYYNLMFYFYAMPFILGDDGINYGKAEPLNFEGKSYPGILISYEAGIGESPEDEYILYYDPDTNQMAWLGYTVTYFSKEKSKEFHFIKYNSWTTVNGVQLPETLHWYKYENNRPTTFRNEVKFVNVKLSEEAFDPAVFAIAEGATIVPKE
ncbi:MAG: hypothetical protein HKN54_02275 [Flavobacteriaceae bacterium]|nr:hypothetical protein [Flavobacteriaceae bacterium]